MKRILFTLAFLATLVVDAMAQNDAVYVYRNDGVINAFLKADIDSICHSCLDLDSVMHKEYVVQEVWTVDSVYRIPLEAIDSVSFVTPPTVYKQGVKNLSDNLMDYIIGAEDMTLKLKSGTPVIFLPLVGDKLVLLEGCEALPNGFAGEVTAVKSGDGCIDVVCKPVYIEDIFDSFCSVQTICGYADSTECNPPLSRQTSPTRAVYNPEDQIYRLGPYTLSANAEISLQLIPDGDLALKGGAGMSVTLAPTFRIHTFLIIGDKQGMYFSSSITGNLLVESTFSLYGGIEWSKDILDPAIEFPIPYTGGLVHYYISPGLFCRASATVTSSVTATANYTFGMAFDYSSIGGNVVRPSLGGRLASAQTDMEGSLDGSIAAGVYLETGFNLVSRELAKVYVRGEYGSQVNGTFVLRNSDVEGAEEGTVLYDRLKASGVEFGPFVSASLGASVLGAGAGPSWQLSRSDETYDLVPTFSNTTLTRSPGAATSVDACSEVSGNCLFTVQVGYKLFDGENNAVTHHVASKAYMNTPMRLEHTFAGLMQNTDYKVFPMVSFFGHDVLASPSAELKGRLPQITSFKVTGSEYSKGKFTNDGRVYDYKFDVAVTAEIDELDGVSDWGYAYEDAYGSVKRVSLMQYGTSYTDTRYSYYRNEAKSVARLYAYVRYEGDQTYYDAEPHEYPLVMSVHTCPDNHHTHAIDLGLPSGTKWACCNVGASAPEGYGGCYAWGETTEKAVYNWDTYAYGSDYYNCVNLGNISGTQYDVAHVRMGAPWVMPSHEQQAELMEHCTREWTSVNGVNGILVTGPNGGQIFLPAAGCRWDDVLDSAGSYGYYWSGTQNPDYSYYAYYLYFESGYWDRYGSNYGLSCNYGRSVRAVCP